MITQIAQVPLIVREYDEAIEFYCEKLGFKLLEDTQRPNKRWVRLGTPGGGQTEILVSRAANAQQLAAVGNQTGGRVLFFFHTDSFEQDFERFKAAGVALHEGPWDHSYGKVAVFRDLYGNRFDLIEPK